MANMGHAVFLEEWLQSKSGSADKTTSRHSSSPSAQAIIQAWSDLRDLLQFQFFHPHHLHSLRTLCDSKNFLYISDPQAKLLLSILSSTNTAFPQESYPLFLRLLYVWVRKSSKQSSVVIGSAVEVLLHLFSKRFVVNKSPFFFFEGVLLLGAISFLPSASGKSKTVCLELLCRLLEEEYPLIRLSEGLMSSVLAGVGYGLSSSVNVYFIRIMDSLFEIWEKEDGPSGSVSHGLMILHMIEWVLSNSLSSLSMDKVDLFRREILGNIKPTYSLFALVMAAAGSLRVFNRSGSSGLKPLSISAEALIEVVARDLASRTKEFGYSVIQPRDSLLLQCVSLAITRCGSISYNPPLLLCIALALLSEIFPLQRIYGRILQLPLDNSGGLELNEVKEHLCCISFKEAGAVTGAFCNQYVSADEESKSIIENIIWEYCEAIYFQHRQVALMLRGINGRLLGDIEKIAESAFLMVVLFALAVTKHRLGSNPNEAAHMKLSVRILVAFSCVEYFRRMRLPEYMDTIRAVVASVQENESACVSFVKSMPSYNDLTNKHVYSSWGTIGCHWITDEVQTARILFYLRVIPTCMEHLPTSVFREVAPTVFLYMGHPDGKVARASYSMFVTFISSGKDLDQGERVSLKEQLVFYYMQRSLEGYPAITPFEGMASGVVAVVRHLPAGSPSILYCIHSLVEKVSSLCSIAKSEDTDLQKTQETDWESCQKMLELLLRLLSLVDVQVLPSLMKLLAQLIVQLPDDRQNVVLSELYQQVAESDDVTRKPALVSWLQSLSYLCSQDTKKKATEGIGSETHSAARRMGLLNLNGIFSRL